MQMPISVLLFAAASAFAVNVAPAGQNPKQPDKKEKGQYDPPATQKPDEATLKTIAEKTEQLRKAITELKKKGNIRQDVLEDVEIYLKAAENIVRFDEWFSKDSGKWAQTTLDQGLTRAKQLAEDKGIRPPENKLGDVFWQNTTGRWVVRAYRSTVDDSIQPYAMILPVDYGKDPEKKWPLQVVLHGRDSSLTEAKFIATHDGGKPGPKLGYILLEVYGRGNNAYRWAGETDVIEAIYAVGFKWDGTKFGGHIIDPDRIVINGFSMGGAGTWHLGLHHPGNFCVMGPGAGFTTTHGYVGGLPKQLPDYQEKCLRIYDAVDYAENAFDIPIVAYSGEIDAQKKAADNIEALLKDFNEPHQFTHLIAPGLAHQMPKEWQDKAQAEYQKYMEKGRNPKPERIRFVTYTPKYGECDWLTVEALERCYEKAVVDARRKGNSFTVTTTNVRRIYLRDVGDGPVSVTIDGQKMERGKDKKGIPQWAEKRDGKWDVVDVDASVLRFAEKPEKQKGQTGPIDDAFTDYFWVVNPSKPGWNESTDKHAAAALAEFASIWDRYFRGKLPMGPDVPNRPVLGAISGSYEPNLVLFGDPESNPLIAKILPKLPITWTKEKLVVNGVEYDPKTHVPVLIYPNPLHANMSYVVINSGHTFKEADLKGTNALLYPRLGDWAVIKPTPTDKDPAAYEVVAAGLFDENWQFPKKK
jgi:hypothetical protein